MRNKLIVWMLILLFVIPSVVFTISEDEYGSISGNVVSEKLPVKIQAIQNLSIIAETTTNLDGSYTINNLSEGKYGLLFIKDFLVYIYNDEINHRCDKGSVNEIIEVISGQKISNININLDIETPDYNSDHILIKFYPGITENEKNDLLTTYNLTVYLISPEGLGYWVYYPHDRTVFELTNMIKRNEHVKDSTPNCIKKFVSCGEIEWGTCFGGYYTTSRPADSFDLDSIIEIAEEKDYIITNVSGIMWSRKAEETISVIKTVDIQDRNLRIIFYDNNRSIVIFQKGTDKEWVIDRIVDFFGISESETEELVYNTELDTEGDPEGGIYRVDLGVPDWNTIRDYIQVNSTSLLYPTYKYKINQVKDSGLNGDISYLIRAINVAKQFDVGFTLGLNEKGFIRVNIDTSDPLTQEHMRDLTKDVADELELKIDEKFIDTLVFEEIWIGKGMLTGELDRGKPFLESYFIYTITFVIIVFLIIFTVVWKLTK